MRFFSWILAFSLFPCFFTQTSNEKHIALDLNNTIMIRGEINEKTATDFVFDLNSRENKKNLFVFLDTNGGSVDAGNKIVQEIQKYKLDCIAQRAISMGFVIFQSCNERYITQLSTLMQHQMSYGIMNEKAKIESYVNYIKQVSHHLVGLQSKKIGISKKEFERRTYNEWWLFGDNAIDENCADELAQVTCSPSLTNQTYSVEKGPYILYYSKCPLISGHVSKKKNKNYSNQDFMFFI